MRLIDADALIERKFILHDMEELTHEEFEKLVNEQPTAYDPEKVRKEIDRVGKSFCDYVACNEECTSCEHHSIMNAVTGIVRKGGVK